MIDPNRRVSIISKNQRVSKPIYLDKPQKLTLPLLESTQFGGLNDIFFALKIAYVRASFKTKMSKRNIKQT